MNNLKKECSISTLLNTSTIPNRLELVWFVVFICCSSLPTFKGNYVQRYTPVQCTIPPTHPINPLSVEKNVEVQLFKLNCPSINVI